MNSLREYSIPTTVGQIAVWESMGKGPDVLFIHGNSSSKKAFYKQFESELSARYHFVAIDLPGHGDSDKAQDREKTYSMDGYADVAIEVIKKIGLEKPVVVGWSLGGHIGISMMQKAKKISGLLITGSPPIKISREGFHQGFNPLPLFQTLFSKIEFTPEEADEFMSVAGFDTKAFPQIVEDALKTDGHARKHLVESMSRGVGGDQKKTLETDDTPLCIIQGENDKGINNKYILDCVPALKNLFNRKVYIIENAGHAVFWEKAKEFNGILELFLSKVTNN